MFQEQKKGQYTKEELAQAWKSVVVKTRKIPTTKEFEKLGLPHINFYNRRWGNYTKFKIAMGVKNVETPPYYKKGNPKRFFKPQEWIQFLNAINNPNHKFWFEFLLHTGMRYDEASNVIVKDIDFINRRIEINKAKGGRYKHRTITISTYLTNRIQQFIKQNKLTPHDNFGFPKLQYMSQQAIKGYCKKAGIQDWQDFSCHNLRKTLEMYGLGIGIDSIILSMHIGHTLDIMTAHYVSSMLLNQQEKILIRSILDDLWM